MIQRVVTWVEEMPGASKRSIWKCMNIGWETFEFAGDDHVAEAIIDDINLDSFVRFALKMVFERLSGLVAFPNKRFKVDALLSVVYGCKHSVIKITAKIINLERIFSNLDWPKMWVWEGFIMLMLT